MDNAKWKLDGTPEEGIAALKELFGLRPDQSFREIKIPIEITEEQKEILLEYLPNLQQYIDDEDIFPLLDAIKAKIQEVGYDENRKLNETGKLLCKLHIELHGQNF